MTPSWWHHSTLKRLLIPASDFVNGYLYGFGAGLMVGMLIGTMIAAILR